jgi:hypothetical protein
MHGRPFRAPENLVARSLTIVDEKGTQRVVLEVTKDGPSVRLNDERGYSRVVLTVTKEGAWASRTRRESCASLWWSWPIAPKSASRVLDYRAALSG